MTPSPTPSEGEAMLELADRIARSCGCCGDDWALIVRALRAAAQTSGVREKIEALAHLYDLKAVNSIFAERTLIYATAAKDIRAISPDTPREGEK